LSLPSTEGVGLASGQVVEMEGSSCCCGWRGVALLNATLFI